MPITAAQFRMAKAALRLNNPDVSAMTGLHRNTLNKVDAGGGTASVLMLLKLSLEAAGVEFIPDDGSGEGVRLKR